MTPSVFYIAVNNGDDNHNIIIISVNIAKKLLDKISVGRGLLMLRFAFLVRMCVIEKR